MAYSFQQSESPVAGPSNQSLCRRPPMLSSLPFSPVLFCGTDGGEGNVSGVSWGLSYAHQAASAVSERHEAKSDTSDPSQCALRAPRKQIHGVVESHLVGSRQDGVSRAPFWTFLSAHIIYSDFYALRTNLVYQALFRHLKLMPKTWKWRGN